VLFLIPLQVNVTYIPVEWPWLLFCRRYLNSRSV